MQKYNPKKIELKWQKKWKKSGIYKTKDSSKKPKFYTLDMFPYPSGAGLHVGHPKGYIATDTVSRFMMLKGYNVLHPMGWDAFGLPAENYAIKNKVHPRISTKKNVAVFKKQLQKFGFTYDWSREINTTDPEFYKWTQWIFLKMFEKGLAYESDEPVNWCPSCKTVLANEDLEGGLCERCGAQVVQKKMKQWVLKMTAYADRLLYDLDTEKLDWENLIVEQQRNWIGRSEGAEVEFPIVIVSDSPAGEKRGNFMNSAINQGLLRRSSPRNDRKIKVYTTRLDTIFGCTYCVVAPEHQIISNLKSQISNFEEVEKYIIKAQNKTELERTELQKEKTGVELKGVKAINPFANEEIPVWVADYVLGFYGTGAVMAVPAHDERDFEFAKKYGLPIKQAIAPLFLGQGIDSPVESEKKSERKVVVAIIKHCNKDEYLCLDWKQFGWKSFVIGGIEEGEDGKDAAIREAIEETGYQNLKIIKKIDGEVHDNFYARHKNVKNRYIKIECYLIELKNEEHNKPEEEHVKNHNYLWVKKNEIANFLNLPYHKYYWQALIEGEQAFTGDGVLINSERFTNLKSGKAREEMTKWLEEQGIGKKKVNYKMRDWVFSRQRYWGEPIPIIHCEKCGAVAVPEKDLPVKLPEVKSYEPTGTGESPLANIDKWVNVKCPKCGGAARRETNTMPQWAGSSWYYLRYIDPKNKKALVDKNKEKAWMPVDLYVGGAEHATRHLLYARFWHKFLYDIGVVSTNEPFKKLVHVGLVNAEDGRKMSKRWGNVVNPDDVIAEFGADSMRMFEMFMGPFSQTVSWSTKGVSGVRRFLERVWNTQSQISNLKSQNQNLKLKTNNELERLTHKTIKKVTEDIENFRFNTAISALMILSNEFEKQESLPNSIYEKFLILLSPFAPHMAEELWNNLGHKKSIFLEAWPKYDLILVQDETINLVISVNGKVRYKMEVKADITEEEAKNMALASDQIKKYVEGKTIKKIIFVKGRLLNIVV